MIAQSYEDPDMAQDLAHAELEQAMADEGPFYTRSNGQKVRLRDMVTNHLKSAHSKLSREWLGHPEIGPMADEIAKRDAEYAAQQDVAQQDEVQQ
jgi:hypothetical protein